MLQDVSFTVEPGEVVVGGSGAGKTTLLEAMAGVRPADGGQVLFEAVDLGEHLDALRSVLGYVPQDDIIHAELPLARTLRYAAAPRLPSSTPTRELEDAAHRALAALDLGAHADVPVGALSGGQRKRASTAVELLTHPHGAFFFGLRYGLLQICETAILRHEHLVVGARIAVGLRCRASTR